MIQQSFGINMFCFAFVCFGPFLESQDWYVGELVMSLNSEQSECFFLVLVSARISCTSLTFHSSMHAFVLHIYWAITGPGASDAKAFRPCLSFSQPQDPPPHQHYHFFCSCFLPALLNITQPLSVFQSLAADLYMMFLNQNHIGVTPSHSLGVQLMVTFSRKPSLDLWD